MNINEEGLLKELEKIRKERDEALELTESRNLFISSISHEIRSPINAILGMINIFLEGERKCYYFHSECDKFHYIGACNRNA